MDTLKKYGLTKAKAILLFLQMFLIIIQLLIAVYLLVFSIEYKLSEWMISSYVFIMISVISIIIYAVIGFKKGEIAYLLAIAPFLIAIFINILIPNRDTFQISMLVLLFALTLVFLFKQDDFHINSLISIAMVVVALSFSIYSSINANVNFLKELSAKWSTYVAMYLSIFIPVIMSATLALTYNVRKTRLKEN